MVAEFRHVFLEGWDGCSEMGLQTLLNDQGSVAGWDLQGTEGGANCLTFRCSDLYKIRRPLSTGDQVKGGVGWTSYQAGST